MFILRYMRTFHKLAQFSTIPKSETELTSFYNWLIKCVNGVKWSGGGERNIEMALYIIT